MFTYKYNDKENDQDKKLPYYFADYDTLKICSSLFSLGCKTVNAEAKFGKYKQAGTFIYSYGYILCSLVNLGVFLLIFSLEISTN